MLSIQACFKLIDLHSEPSKSLVDHFDKLLQPNLQLVQVRLFHFCGRLLKKSVEKRHNLVNETNMPIFMTMRISETATSLASPATERVDLTAGSVTDHGCGKLAALTYGIEHGHHYYRTMPSEK